MISTHSMRIFSTFCMIETTSSWHLASFIWPGSSLTECHRVRGVFAAHIAYPLLPLFATVLKTLLLSSAHNCAGLADYVRLLKYGDSLYRCKQLKRAALVSALSLSCLKSNFISCVKAGNQAAWCLLLLYGSLQRSASYWDNHRSI